MEISTGLSVLRRKRKPIAMAIGFFDGLHTGHCRVIEKTLERSAELGGQAWIYTFDRHPLTIVNPDRAPSLLMSIEYKLELMAGLGVDGCIVMPFTPEFGTMAPEAFVEKLIAGIPMLSDIFVGKNWRFGRGGKGNTKMLAGLCRKAGIRVNVVRPSVKSGMVVSSTAIRVALRNVDLAAVESLLGRPYSFWGKVVRGRNIGRKIGFPTANIETQNMMMFPMGVYAVRVMVEGCGDKMLDGVMNYGLRPTFGVQSGNRSMLEVHILGANIDIYGKMLEVFIYRRIRGEKRFGSVTRLRDCISSDIEETKKILREIALHSKQLYIYCHPNKKEKRKESKKRDQIQL